MERDICTICVSAIVEDASRATAKLACKHIFHLSCIGSEFNIRGEMRCPNCRHVEQSEWLFAQPPLPPQQQQQEDEEEQEEEEEEEAEVEAIEEEEEEEEAEQEEEAVEEGEEDEGEQEEDEEEEVPQMYWRNLRYQYIQRQLNVLQQLLDENDLFWFQDSNELREVVNSIFAEVESPEEHYHILLQPGGDYWCPSTDFILQLTPPEARQYDHPEDSSMTSTRRRSQLNDSQRERRARERWAPYYPVGGSMISTRPRPLLNSSQSTRAALDTPNQDSPYLVPPLRPYVQAVLQSQPRGSCLFHTGG